jgi:hypothetical protein
MSGMVKQGLEMMAKTLSRKELLECLRNRKAAPIGEMFDAMMEICRQAAESIEESHDPDQVYEPALVANIFAHLVTQTAEVVGDSTPLALRIPTLAVYIFPEKFAIEVIKCWEVCLPDPE